MGEQNCSVKAWSSISNGENDPLHSEITIANALGSQKIKTTFTGEKLLYNCFYAPGNLVGLCPPISLL